MSIGIISNTIQKDLGLVKKSTGPRLLPQEQQENRSRRRQDGGRQAQEHTGQHYHHRPNCCVYARSRIDKPVKAVAQKELTSPPIEVKVTVRWSYPPLTTMGDGVHQLHAQGGGSRHGHHYKALRKLCST
jgi:hypothetical protein